MDDDILKQLTEDAKARYEAHPVIVSALRDKDGTPLDNDFLAKASEDFPVQSNYFRTYLLWMDATIVLSERNYHDWEYADQFRIYYGASSAGYSNLCRRHHYFASVPSFEGVLGLDSGGLEARLQSEVFPQILGIIKDVNTQVVEGELGKISTISDFFTVECEIINRLNRNTDKNDENNKKYVKILVKCRRVLYKKIVEMATEERDRLREGSDHWPTWNCGQRALSGRRLPFPDLQHLVYLESVIGGVHALDRDETGGFFEMATLIQLLAGMPMEQGKAVEWMNKTLQLAGADHPLAHSLLQNAYLAYVVQRPLPHSPIGRAIFRWPLSPDTAFKPRVTNTAQNYKSHFCGITMSLKGLAFQLADSTGACASQSLWSALQAWPYRHHTTSSSPVITILANKISASNGRRTFPSHGLNAANLAEAIRQHDGLAPLVIHGDSFQERPGIFNKGDFNALCAAMLFGGFPVILLGKRKSDNNEKHAICLTGFRAEWLDVVENRHSIYTLCGDSSISTYYAHDVNIGINARYDVLTTDDSDEMLSLDYSGLASAPCVHRIAEVWGYENEEALKNAPRDDKGLPIIKENNANSREMARKLELSRKLIKLTGEPFEPDTILVALPHQIRLDPRRFLYHVRAQASVLVGAAINLLFVRDTECPSYKFWPFEDMLQGLTYAIRFVGLSGYLEEGLKRHLPPDPMLLSEVRKALVEQVRPLPKYIGLMRVGIFVNEKHYPLADLLFDTTESDPNHPVFACVSFMPACNNLVFMAENQTEECIDAFSEHTREYSTARKKRRISTFGTLIKAYTNTTCPPEVSNFHFLKERAHAIAFG